jgi:beta-ureidopropionase / N-carbamoyl-L-amino-acid hydrolase
VGTLNSAFRCARLPSTRLALWASGLEAHAVIGAIDGGGVCRIALTDADKAGRDQLVAWLRELGLEVRVDRIGNVFGIRAGRTEAAPVMTGSHIDTVATGGRYDGNHGVLAGLAAAGRQREAGPQ